jgi:hypothetical protein
VTADHPQLTVDAVRTALGAAPGQPWRTTWLPRTAAGPRAGHRVGRRPGRRAGRRPAAGAGHDGAGRRAVAGLADRGSRRRNPVAARPHARPEWSSGQGRPPHGYGAAGNGEKKGGSRHSGESLPSLPRQVSCESSPTDQPRSSGRCGSGRSSSTCPAGSTRARTRWSDRRVRTGSSS